ncbi:MAG TPA: hypothetical protein VGJ58_11775 [Gaiellaceae bacterium]
MSSVSHPGLSFGPALPHGTAAADLIALDDLVHAGNDPRIRLAGPAA